MKIARVVTLCVTLISTFLQSETVHPNERRSQFRDLSSLKKSIDGRNLSDITFIINRPESLSRYRRAQSSSQSISNKAVIRNRSGRVRLIRSYGPNRLKVNRRRRQLRYNLNGEQNYVGRSYEVTDNNIENQQIETIQSPEAFEDGAVHLEPIYRVSKNKNIFDSIVDILRRVIDPPKTVGPLVGPFRFPGVGEKVYVRLLEPVRPDRLIVRLVSHSPTTELDSNFEKGLHEIPELLEQSEIPIKQEIVGLSTNDGSYKEHIETHLAPDSLISSSNNVGQYTKPKWPTIQQTADPPKGGRVLKTHKLNVKQNDLNENNKYVRHRKRNPSQIILNHSRSVLNDTQEKYLPQKYFGPFYQTYLGLNQTNDNFPYSENILTDDGIVYDSYKSNIHSQVSPVITKLRPQNISEDSAGNGPRYSIEFASKKMRYLNLDGSVEPAVGEATTEEFRPTRLNPILPTVSEYADSQWNTIKKSTTESTRLERYSKIFQDRSDVNDDHLVQMDKKLAANVENDSRNKTGGIKVTLENLRTRNNFNSVLISNRQQINGTNDLDNRVANTLKNNSTNFSQEQRIESVQRNTTTLRKISEE